MTTKMKYLINVSVFTNTNINAGDKKLENKEFIALEQAALAVLTFKKSVSIQKEVPVTVSEIKADLLAKLELAGPFESEIVTFKNKKVDDTFLLDDTDLQMKFVINAPGVVIPTTTTTTTEAPETTTTTKAPVKASKTTTTTTVAETTTTTQANP